MTGKQMIENYIRLMQELLDRQRADYIASQRVRHGNHHWPQA